MIPLADPSVTPDAPGKDERFRKSERLTRRSQFLETRRAGRRAEGRWVILYLVPNDLGFARIGLTASKKVGNAPVRNRWKRRLREIFRHQKALFSSYDLVVIIKRGNKEPSFEALQSDLLKTLGKGQRFLERDRT